MPRVRFDSETLGVKSEHPVEDPCFFGFVLPFSHSNLVAEFEGAPEPLLLPI